MERNRNRPLWTILGAMALAVLMFLSGYFFAVERTVSFQGLTSRPLADWFKPQAAILIDEEWADAADLDAFNRVLGLLQTRYYQELDPEIVMESVIKGLAAGTGDPYTVYFTPEEMISFMESSSGRYVGIGVSVSMDEQNILTIAEVFPDSPARSAGLRIGDKIVGVDGEDVTGIAESSLIIKKIKGEEGTEVAIRIYRPGENDYLDVTMKRAAINVPNVYGHILDENIAYIRISQFDSDMARSFSRMYNQLAEEGAESLLLDLRYNPGGDYSQVVAIADMLLPEGLIVYTEDRNGRREEKRSDPSELNVPMVVLVNGYSASASEILAAALQDYEKAVIIGEQTFGKGLVQTIDAQFSNGAGLKYTISTYYSPKGMNIQSEGVKPDIEVVLSEEWISTSLADIPEGKDNQLEVAIKTLKNAMVP